MAASASSLADTRFAFFSHLDVNLYYARIPVMERLLAAGAQVYAIVPLGKVAQDFPKHGVELIPFELNRTTYNPWIARREIARLRIVLEEINPHLLQTFTLRPNVYGALAGRRAGVPAVISTVTGLGSLYTEGGGWKKALARGTVNLATRHALARSDRVVFQNRDDLQLYLDRGLCRRDQAHLILSSGVDLDTYSPARVTPEARRRLRAAWGIGRDEVVVAMVSRLIVPKGVREFLRAAERLRGHARFVLVGAPDPGNPDSIPQHELSGYVERGVVVAPGRQENVPEWLAASDVFALPSFYREGVPRTPLEAAAMELPVVTVDGPGCRETVRDGETGLLVPPRDVGALAEALTRLIDDPQRRRSMGERGRKLVETHFSLEAVIDQYLDLYRATLQKGVV